jgi:ABC-type glycerol-3-phosphate transport system substrate-binding protein
MEVLNMKRKMFSLIAIIMIAAMVLSACAKTTPEPEVPVEGAVDWSKVTPAKNIVFWHQHTGEAREAAMKTIVDGFNATNEYGITLTADLYQDACSA